MYIGTFTVYTPRTKTLPTLMYAYIKQSKKLAGFNLFKKDKATYPHPYGELR